MTEPAAPARANRFARLRAATDRVPTKWFASIGTGLFLAVTAAFGGLAEAAEPPIATIAAGETHTNELYAITVEKAFLFEELSEAGAAEVEGMQVLALRVTLENVWTEPQRTGRRTSTEEIFAISVPGAEFENAALLADGTLFPVMQPNVPATVALTWYVPTGSIAPGDQVTVTLSDPTLWVGSFVSADKGWSSDGPSAEVALTVAAGGAAS